MSSLQQTIPFQANKEEENQRTNSFHVSNPTTTTNLSLPTETFLKAAISLKEQVHSHKGVEREWWRVYRPTVYTGLLGTVFTCLRSYEAYGNEEDLLLCAEIVDTCAVVAHTFKRHVTFLCGRGGVYALGAVVANYRHDDQRRELFLNLFLEVAQERALPIGLEEGGFGMSYELLYGRAGFLWAALFINKYLGQDTLPKNLLMPVVEAVLAGGRAGASNHTSCPLMFRWHGTRYWGAAHGLAGILHVQDSVAADLSDSQDPAIYNLQCFSREALGAQRQQGILSVVLREPPIHAESVFPNDREFHDAAIEAGETVWNKGLVKKMGLSDGVSGNAYALLSFYRLTGKSVYLQRANVFASFLFHNARDLVFAGHVRGSDRAYSLFEELSGTACLLFDVFSPERSRFPGFEL
ncbi:hypothetical protein GIB67_031405 [Kingdonia uniflora]|uniref:LanC-like protein GCL1 n=1 Tax=Kingdonia uniflora TaxID=39325 RepID=A0A7J7MB16_9MAGN|nr:hypothetical protein GIB67_031405 [Kingdonia uniflora]